MNTTNPILFLDIDDVVCLNERYSGFDVRLALDERLPAHEEVLREVLNRDACAVLRSLHDGLQGQLRYVVSSTWRQALSREQLQTVFRAGGLNFVSESLHPAWCTPAELGRATRQDVIAYWLDLYHQGEPFVILDDTFSGASLKPALRDRQHAFFGRVVLCRQGEGLRPEHLAPLRNALSKPPKQLDANLGDKGSGQ